MKVILTHEVANLGAAGDVVDVKDGYARNFLMPRGFATPWTKGGQKQVDAIIKARAARAIKSHEDAIAAKGTLEGLKVKVAAKTGTAGRLFGGISAADVVAAVSAAGGPQLDRRAVAVPDHIKSLGSYTATVNLHPEVKASMPFEVVSA